MTADRTYPNAAVKLGADALTAEGLLNNAGYIAGDERRAAKVVLAAAWPVIERAVLQQAAAAMLNLAEADHHATRNVGPYGSLGASVRRLLRGQPLPSAAELRGGSVPQEFR